ncbi:protein of unknown function DUF1284 [Thermodesulfobacterium geofontis OPF15]|uniref:DUF1284 domain-containing protein n=1 Tax=Thermodesulfobacterium geofontis (strain OPF15) TaxID=795359 RepID=F8C5I1_THEGP|nr:DUF1284 domain-containing protein [Thermodesulfobacterium geofontis]AEH22960.1 protein of unknown function DUF1284 [Thermodesulfobacterium geofontis OPF15]
MLNLRGHHLICLNFFKGEGYDEVFIKNLEKILSKMEKENIKVVEDFDDVCKSCPYLKDDKCQYKEGAEEKIREQDKVALELLKIKEGEIVKWEEIKNKLPEVFSQWYERYCYDCDWLKVCETHQIFQDLFQEVLSPDKKILSLFLKVRKSFPEVKDSVSLLKPYANLHFDQIEDKVPFLSMYYQLHLYSPSWIIKRDEFERIMGFEPDLIYKSPENTYIMSVIYNVDNYVTEGAIAYGFSEALALSRGMILTYEEVDFICFQRGYGKQLLLALQHDLFPGMVTKLFVDREDIQRRIDHLKMLLGYAS